VEYGSYDREDGTSIPTVDIRVRELIMLGSRTPRQPVTSKYAVEL